MHDFVCAARETPIFSPEFPGAYNVVSKLPKNLFIEHHHFNDFLVDFAVLETIRDQNFFNFNPFIPLLAGSAQTQSVWQRCGLAAWPECYSSGDSQKNAQNGLLVGI